MIPKIATYEVGGINFKIPVFVDENNNITQTKHCVDNTDSVDEVEAGLSDAEQAERWFHSEQEKYLSEQQELFTSYK